MKTIKLFIGETNVREDSPVHPMQAVKEAKKYVDDFLTTDEKILNLHSNHIDFITMIWHYVNNNKDISDIVYLIVYLNSKEILKLELIFEDFVRALDFISIHSKKEIAF